MRSLGRLGLALSIAGLATAATAAPDSRSALPSEDWNAAQMERAPAGAPRGGWGRQGWSDGAEYPAAGRSEPRRWRDGDMRRDGPPGEWRRQTWDGGRGPDFAYRRGGRLPPIFVSPSYVVPDWDAYRLAPPGPGRRWVRYYDDAVLIDGRGYIVDAVPAIGWDDRGPALAYDRHWRDDGMAGHPGRPQIDHRGPGPAPQVYYGANGATTIVITTAPSVATTTTTATERYVTTRKWGRKARPSKLIQTKPARTVYSKARRTVQTKPAR